MFHLSPAGKIFLDVCAGATCPLSTAMVQNSRMSLPIDKIIAEQHDILNDFHYERILRIASSGCAGYTAASPSCAEFSLLKLIQPGRPSKMAEAGHWKTFHRIQ